MIDWVYRELSSIRGYHLATWLLVFGGWYFTNHQSKKVATRKEFRDAIDEVKEMVGQVRNLACEFYGVGDDEDLVRARINIDSNINHAATLIDALETRFSISVDGVNKVYASVIDAVTNDQRYDVCGKYDPASGLNLAKLEIDGVCYDRINEVVYQIDTLVIELESLYRRAIFGSCSARIKSMLRAKVPCLQKRNVQR